MCDDEDLKWYSMYIAMVVRNEIEDFHCRYLSDEQMKELNPIIRNAIYTAIFAFDNYDKEIIAHSFVDFNMSMIPDYWEKPELTDGYKKIII